MSIDLEQVESAFVLTNRRRRTVFTKLNIDSTPQHVEPTAQGGGTLHLSSCLWRGVLCSWVHVNF
jgi:hypothetical protein